MVDIGNFTSATFENFDIDLVQNEVGGGTVSIEQIDEAMGNNPDAGSIVISGLKQDTFEYLIKQYGKQLTRSLFGKTKWLRTYLRLEL